MEANRKDTFLSTIDKHKKIIYKIVHSYCKHAEDRKDLEQEIIIQLWKSYDNYNPEYKYTTWMYRIALNVAISFYRKEKNWISKNAPFDEELIHTLPEDKTNDTALDHNIELLQAFISNLNELNKALMLLYLGENSYEEIAEILGISKTNVATKISRLKHKLREEFKTIASHGSH